MISSRVTSSSINAGLVSQINNNYTNYAKLTEQLTTGNRVNSLMDDPIQSINIISSTRELGKVGIWSANIGVLVNEIKDSSETIDKAMEKAQRAKDLAATAANETSTKSVLESTMTELNEIIRGLVDMANTNYNGNYIYGGTNTKTPPYVIEYGIDDTGALTDEIIGVKYTGTPMDEKWERQLEIAGGLFQTVNVTGAEVFGDYDKEPVFEADGVTPVLDAEGEPTYTVNSESGIFANLLNFKNKLQETIDNLTKQENLPENATEAEKDALKAEIKAGYDSFNGLIDGFTQSLEKMTVVNSNFGTITNKLDMSSESLLDSENNLKEFISGIKEVDVTQAVSDWYSAQYAYQASMQASTSIMQMSLLNYM